MKDERWSKSSLRLHRSAAGFRAKCAQQSCAVPPPPPPDAERFCPGRARCATRFKPIEEAFLPAASPLVLSHQVPWLVTPTYKNSTKDSAPALLGALRRFMVDQTEEENTRTVSRTNREDGAP